jgi:hypothetical protein
MGLVRQPVRDDGCSGDDLAQLTYQSEMSPSEMAARPTGMGE